MNKKQAAGNLFLRLVFYLSIDESLLWRFLFQVFMEIGVCRVDVWFQEEYICATRQYVEQNPTNRLPGGKRPSWSYSITTRVQLCVSGSMPYCMLRSLV
jgi:hypothetical protein